MIEQVIRINGGRRLEGRVEISGAKNAALPCLFASLLTDADVTLYNVPKVDDVTTARHVLRALGKDITTQGNTVTITKASNEELYVVPQKEAVAMRASILCLGPLIAKLGKALVPLPGGCDFGVRPINLHIESLEKMGVRISLKDECLNAKGAKLAGAKIQLAIPTFTGTENILMAATMAKGTTEIDNAAREPEVENLARMLVAMGARIRGIGSSRLLIEGVTELGGCKHAIIPDRIEAGTYLAAAAATRGKVELANAEAEHLSLVLDKLLTAGASINVAEGSVALAMDQQPAGITIHTENYPGFPTDLQAQFMALGVVSSASTLIVENVWRQRFRTAEELRRLGAIIEVDDNQAQVTGDAKLVGATVVASDLRASAALVIAGLCAEGTTTIKGVAHLLRGYEDLPEKFGALGADIKLS